MAFYVHLVVASIVMDMKKIPIKTWVIKNVFFPFISMLEGSKNQLGNIFFAQQKKIRSEGVNVNVGYLFKFDITKSW